jgi:hypothetical protein
MRTRGQRDPPTRGSLTTNPPLQASLSRERLEDRETSELREQMRATCQERDITANDGRYLVPRKAC